MLLYTPFKGNLDNMIYAHEMTDSGITIWFTDGTVLKRTKADLANDLLVEGSDLQKAATRAAKELCKSIDPEYLNPEHFQIVLDPDGTPRSFRIIHGAVEDETVIDEIKAP